MSVGRLKELVPPPTTPTDVGTPGEWETAEEELGLRLPADYRQFIFEYGSGLFAGLYLVYNPFSTSPYLRLADRVAQVCKTWRDLKRSEGDRFVPYPIYPDKGGLLPWARDENGNDYYWLTKGSPSKWVVVQNGVRGKGFARHDCGMSEFLLGVLQGRILPLASDYPNPECFVFHPSQPKRRTRRSS